MGENESEPEASVIVDLDGDRINSRRYAVDLGWGNCNFVQDLDSVARHRLIAHWLGVPDKDMAWQPVLSTTIIWAGKADYERRLGRIVESQREKLRASMNSLRQRGFLTKDEAATVAPQLSVVVKCDIHPCPLH